MKSKRICWMFLAIFPILGWFPVPSAGAIEARDIAKKAFPSVVMLVMKDKAGQPLSLGSGFFVREDIVATNLHVVGDAVGGYAKIVGQQPKYDIDGYVAIDYQRDLIFLKLGKAKAPLLPLGDSNSVAVGDDIFVIGNPQGLEGTFSEGIVSGIRAIGKDSILQITAPISPGSSGGPVLNEKGKVIGVAVATFKEGQNLNFAIPSSYLSPLLADTKPVKPLKGEQAAEKKSKSILSDLGGKNTEGVVGRQFLWGESSFDSIYFSFTLQNHFQKPIRNVLCLVVFYDIDNQPIETETIEREYIISPGLAKRITGSVHESVRRLTTRKIKEKSLPFMEYYEDKPFTAIEFRILNFQIVEVSEEEP